MSLNRYTYANGDPMEFFDPDGFAGWNPVKAAKDGYKAVKKAAGKALDAVGEVVGAVVDTAEAVVDTAARVVDRAATAAAGAGLGAAAGVATCKGDLGCVADSALAGAAGQVIAGQVGRDALVGAATGGAFHGAGAAGRSLRGRGGGGGGGGAGSSGVSSAADDSTLHSSNFVVHPNGEIVPVPTGAVGPTPTRTGAGFQFTGGHGGHGLDSRVANVRIMDPVRRGQHPSPNGYVSYSNAGRQTVNPRTGRTIAPSDPMWHWEWSSQ